MSMFGNNEFQVANFASKHEQFKKASPSNRTRGLERTIN